MLAEVSFSFPKNFRMGAKRLPFDIFGSVSGKLQTAPFNCPLFASPGKKNAMHLEPLIKTEPKSL